MDFPRCILSHGEVQYPSAGVNAETSTVGVVSVQYAVGNMDYVYHGYGRKRDLTTEHTEDTKKGDMSEILTTDYTDITDKRKKEGEREF